MLMPEYEPAHTADADILMSALWLNIISTLYAVLLHLVLAETLSSAFYQTDLSNWFTAAVITVPCFDSQTRHYPGHACFFLPLPCYCSCYTLLRGTANWERWRFRKDEAKAGKARVGGRSWRLYILTRWAQKHDKRNRFFSFELEVIQKRREPQHNSCLNTFTILISHFLVQTEI